MILVECNPDEFFISKMGFNARKIKHQQGKGEVIRNLKKGKAKIGIIDEDPGKGTTPLLDEYDLVDETTDTMFLTHSSRRCHLVVLKPDLETWILKRAGICGMRMSKYDLPNDPCRLHSIIHIERNSRFRAMIDELIKKDVEVKQISKWIREHHS